MLSINIEQWVPKFLLADKNGYALAKAIEAALRALNSAVKQGIDLITKPDTMPEWRLDELAWEYNLIYDYSVPIDTKRGWIKNANRFYALYGTPEGIVQYLQSVYDNVNVDESGDPYHFSVTVDGVWSSAADEWTRESINNIKNARSILDLVTFNAGEIDGKVYLGAAVTGEEIAINAGRANENEWLDMEIVDGRLVYNRTDTTDIYFELVDGHLIGRWIDSRVNFEIIDGHLIMERQG